MVWPGTAWLSAYPGRASWQAVGWQPGVLSRREAAQARTSATSTHAPRGQGEHRAWNIRATPQSGLSAQGSALTPCWESTAGALGCPGPGALASHAQFLSAHNRQVRCESLPAAPCDLGPMTPGGSQTISQHPEQAALCHSPTSCNSGAAAGRAMLGDQVLACPSEAGGSPAMQCWVPGLCHL